METIPNWGKNRIQTWQKLNVTQDHQPATEFVLYTDSFKRLKSFALN